MLLSSPSRRWRCRRKQVGENHTAVYRGDGRQERLVAGGGTVVPGVGYRANNSEGHVVLDADLQVWIPAPGKQTGRTN